MSIPIVVGVTGHRKIRKDCIGKIQEKVHDALDEIRRACPDSKLVMLNSLAGGADIICALQAADMGYAIVCPLPTEKEIYLKDFSEEDRQSFEKIFSSAEKAFITPSIADSDDRKTRFLKSGLFVASHCHVLISLWDGEDAKSGGCGSAEITYAAVNGTVHGECSTVFDSTPVIHIMTPREDSSYSGEIFSRVIESEKGILSDVLKMTNEFNADAKQHKCEDKKLSGRKERTLVLNNIENCYSKASGMCSHFQKSYFRSMLIMSLLCVGLVLSYLVYDEAEMRVMLLLYGIILFVYYFLYRRVCSGRIHEKYLSYRMLAETMRVQFYLSGLGIDDNIGNYFTWTQKHDSTWIKCALDAITSDSCENALSADEIRNEWIEKQLDYHKNAHTKNTGKSCKAQNITSAMIILTVLLFAFVAAAEYVLPNFMQLELFGMKICSWLKILWGSISAVTLFVSLYYGRLSYERKSEDNEKMYDLYEKALEKLDGGADIKQLCLTLAKEEIIENGNWVSYCRQNRPDFSL